MQHQKQQTSAHHPLVGYRTASCTAGPVEGLRQGWGTPLLPSDTANALGFAGPIAAAGRPSPAHAGPTGHPGPADGALMRPVVLWRMPRVTC